MKVRKSGSKRNAHGTQKPANILVAKRERKKTTGDLDVGA